MDNRDRFLEAKSIEFYKAELVRDLFLEKKYYGFETWEEFCKAPIASGGLSISPRTAKKMIELYESFVTKLNVPISRLVDIGTSKLYKILPFVNEDNYAELLDKAETLSSTELGYELKGVIPEECEHHNESWLKCEKCGKWTKG